MLIARAQTIPMGRYHAHREPGPGDPPPPGFPPDQDPIEEPPPPPLEPPV
ncbi:MULTISPECIES: hypothetical protein [unclassified Cupriavidus]|nr:MULTISPECIES: hypothetical protein [unclassified Cupriavidus]